MKGKGNQDCNKTARCLSCKSEQNIKQECQKVDKYCASTACFKRKHRIVKKIIVILQATSEMNAIPFGSLENFVPRTNVILDRISYPLMFSSRLQTLSCLQESGCLLLGHDFNFVIDIPTYHQGNQGSITWPIVNLPRILAPIHRGLIPCRQPGMKTQSLFSEVFFRNLRCAP